MSNSAQVAPSQWGQTSVTQPMQTKEPDMLDNLKTRRQALLTELRDTEQAIEALEANPSFAQVMKTVIRAHRY